MSADPPPQNIYDDPDFFDGYSKLERFGEGWTRAFEHRHFMSLLLEIAGRQALDLGCGVGQLAQHLAEQGAAKVVAVDSSERMLALARAEWSHSNLTYQRSTMEDLAFPAASFDLIVSSMAFHYVGDFAGLARRIASWLAPGGVLVFSTEHPVYLSRGTAEGWIADSDGKCQGWLLDRYGDEGLREETWIAAGVQKYHRIVSTILNDLIAAGLVIDRVLEPVPDAAMLQRRPDWADEGRRPFCLLVRAHKA
jgi:SAM-dependent methyltransferase